MKYNKLVRDKIPEYIKQKGGRAEIHIAELEEYWEKLKEKLKEEVSEFYEAENIEELADVMEVIDTIIEFKKFSKKEIEKVRIDKAEKRGRFTKRIILDES